MKKISLKKITAIVVTCTIGSYIANASENELTTEIKAVTEQVTAPDNTLNKFRTLVKQFDLDKDGLLSKAEVNLSKLDQLITHFTDIDLNTDLDINEAEFNQYIAQVK